MITTNILDAKQVLDDNNIAVYEFEHNISYDNHIAQIHFDEFESGDMGSKPILYGSRQTNYMVIAGEGVDLTDSYYSIEELDAMSKDELVELGYYHERYALDTDMDKDEIIDDIRQISIEDYYNDHYANERWRDLDCDYVIRGYSQGDAVAVKTIGTIYWDEQALQHLFFDAPVSGTIEIIRNGEVVREIYADEMLDDYYEWDKEEFIQNLRKATEGEEYSELLNQFVDTHIPEYLDYD